ncbi:MAG: phytochelatin synthase family protein [Cyanobium sp.]
MRRVLVAGVLLALLGPSPAAAQAAIPLIPLNDATGRTLLERSRARTDFLPLVEQFVTQANLAFCGVASAVMALNSLAVPAPAAAGYGPYHFWTQDNLFQTAAAEATVTQTTVARRGLTLAQLAGLLAQPGVTVQRWHGDQLSLPQLRGLLRQSLADPSDRLLVNYHRSALGQQGGGHISPLAAYDARGDRVLLLDVARYRYPSVWVPIPALWQAIRMVDPDSGLSRGLVRLRWNAAAAPPPPQATPRSVR